jgi:uncharacterized membrane protein YeaQ/YmgE (transglycosylase-associated protein family)
MITNAIGWIIFGLIAGVVAKLLMPGRDPGGFIITILLGIAGSLIGGYLGSMFGVGGGGFFSFVMAVVGALLLLMLYRLIRRNNTAINRRPTGQEEAWTHESSMQNDVGG